MVTETRDSKSEQLLRRLREEALRSRVQTK